MSPIDLEGLEIFRDTPAGMIPCDGGEFVRLKDAERYFQWYTLNQVLNALNALEGKTVRKSEVYRAVMAMRPEPAKLVEPAEQASFDELSQ